MSLTEFRVTFGQMYAREPHPTFPDAHPDGWLAVEAENEMSAREAVFAQFGRAWSFIYHPTEAHYPDHDWYPRGELGRIVAPAVTR